jgi:hypothetical protein
MVRLCLVAGMASLSVTGQVDCLLMCVPYCSLVCSDTATVSASFPVTSQPGIFVEPLKTCVGEGDVFLRNVGNRLQSSAASCPRRSGIPKCVVN